MPCACFGGRDMELEFEIPFRELGFSGVPHRTASTVKPTVNCLVRALPARQMFRLLPHAPALQCCTLIAWWRPHACNMQPQGKLAQNVGCMMGSVPSVCTVSKVLTTAPGTNSAPCGPQQGIRRPDPYYAKTLNPTLNPEPTVAAGVVRQVELLEMPFTVITMAEVNIVNLERVGFNLRNFDMTIVFKARFELLKS